MREKTVDRLAQDIKDELVSLSQRIFDKPELGNQEHYAAAQHIALLKRHGFTVTEQYLDVATGFKAVYRAKAGGPTVAYLAEYDALPGIGHGCGHNLLGATSTGAAILLSKLLDDQAGSVVVFGTPAEETSGAKVSYAEKGAFDEIDAAMVAHPNHAYNRSGSSLAMQAIQFEFYGKSSHAAAAPEKGINALDAVINTYNTINALRQQIKSDARIHGVIIDGGKAANVIPDYSCAQFYVRAKTKKYLLQLVEKVKNCARGAAMATATRLEISNYEFSYDDLVTNHMLDNLFTEKLIELGLAPEKIKPARESYGSLDAGNVSHVCPTIHPYFDITNDANITAHTSEFAKATLTDYAIANMMTTVKALALSGEEIIKNPDCLKAIKQEFAESKTS